MEYNNNTFEVDELHKLVATEKIKIKHIIKVYNAINKQTTGIRDYLKKNYILPVIYSARKTSRTAWVFACAVVE